MSGVRRTARRLLLPRFVKTSALVTVIASAALFAAGAACSSSEQARSTLPAHCASAPEDEVPDDLACTGLYTDLGTKTLAPTAIAYAPAAPLWSDGYDKDRWIELPAGTAIDASNVDDWRFPVGTKAWKEFRRGERKIETRFFWKVSDDRWLQASYVWSEDGTKATRGEGTDLEVDGAPYHVPKTQDCNACHRGRKDKLLGFEAVSLAQTAAKGLTLSKLIEDERIAPAPAQKTIALPDPALGVLHANCGITCHNGTPTATAYSTKLRMRLGFDEIVSAPVERWESYQTLVGVDATMPGWAGEVRLVPGSPETSLIVTVMRLRGEGQMPPIASDVVDEQGVGAVEAWIRSLSKAPGDAPPGHEPVEGPPGGDPPGAPPGGAPPGATPPVSTSCAGGGFAEVEGNDTVATANVLGAALKFCGSIASSADADHFTFTMPANAKSFRFERSYSGSKAPEVTWTSEGVTTAGTTPAPFFPGKSYVVRVSSATPLEYGIVMTITR